MNFRFGVSRQKISEKIDKLNTRKKENKWPWIGCYLVEPKPDFFSNIKQYFSNYGLYLRKILRRRVRHVVKRGKRETTNYVKWSCDTGASEHAKENAAENRVYAGLCTFQLPPNPDRADPWPTEADKGVLHKINKANKSTLNVHKQISKWSSSELFVALAIQIYVELRGQGIVDHFLLSRKN